MMSWNPTHAPWDPLLRRYGDTWQIPQVKFATHALFSFSCLIVLAFWLILPRRKDFSTDWHLSEILEVVFWIFYFGRVLEEFKQMWSQVRSHPALSTCLLPTCCSFLPL